MTMRRNAGRWMLVMIAAALCAPSALAQDKADHAADARSLEGSIVRVEFALRYDKGESPEGGGWTYVCPSCGNVHAMDFDDLISEERTAERVGYLLSPTEVVTSDPGFHPRFIKAIAVRLGDHVVDSTVTAYAAEQAAVRLTLAEPLAAGKPLAFAPDSDGPFRAVTAHRLNSVWSTTISPVPDQVTVNERGKAYRSAPNHGVILGAGGAPVGMTMTGYLPVDGSWKRPPLDWEWIERDQLDGMLASLEDLADQSILRVSLSLRSPSQSDQMSGYMYYMDEDAEATERDVVGVMVDPQRVLIPVLLKPETTARLERIRVHAADGRTIPATFAGSLRDYGAFVADLEEPISGVASLSRENVLNYEDKLLLSADVRVQGENRVSFVQHNRIPSFDRGWKDQVYPQPFIGHDDFLFDREGRLVAMPLARRQKVSVEEEWSRDVPVMTASNYLADVLDNLEEHCDPVNVPLSEEDENRVAWLGVELQPLDRDLARINNVSDLTNDGQTGAIVTHVYEGSPAANSTLELGDILIRLHVLDQPRPIEIMLEDAGFFGMEMFPWDQLDELPEEYYDQIPPPWPAVANSLNKRLTQLGFGAEVEIEFVRSGERMRQPMTIEQSPRHYQSAAKLEVEPIGVTVKNMTYEVRRYLQRTDDEPGVIVFKLEPGSKASVAGLRPFELITHVNDEAVANIDDFQRLVTDQTDLRLNVRRMVRGRIVRLTLDEPIAFEEEEEAEEEDAGDGD